MSIFLAIGSKVVLDSIYTVLIVFCNAGAHAIAKHITCWIMQNLSYDAILGMN